MDAGLVGAALGEIEDGTGEVGGRPVGGARDGAAHQDGEVAAVFSAQAQLGLDRVGGSAERTFEQGLEGGALVGVHALDPERLAMSRVGGTRALHAHHLQPACRVEALAGGHIPVPPAVVGAAQHQLEALLGLAQLTELVLDELVPGAVVDGHRALLGEHDQHLGGVLADDVEHACDGGRVGREDDGHDALAADTGAHHRVEQVVVGAGGEAERIEPHRTGDATRDQLVEDPAAHLHPAGRLLQTADGDLERGVGCAQRQQPHRTHGEVEHVDDGFRKRGRDGSVVEVGEQAVREPIDAGELLHLTVEAGTGADQLLLQQVERGTAELAFRCRPTIGHAVVPPAWPTRYSAASAVV